MKPKDESKTEAKVTTPKTQSSWLYRGFLIVMAVLIALGIALLLYGAAQHGSRPLMPAKPGGSVRYSLALEVAEHV